MDETKTIGDILFTLSLIGGLLGLLFMVGWTTFVVFSWLGNRLPWRRAPSWVAGSSLPPAALLAIDPYRAAYNLALREWGTTIIDNGYSRGMGWTELLFQLDPAVAGVSEVLTVLGEARFTPGLRCMAIVDRDTITVLDRQRRHGVRLTAAWPQQGVKMTLEGAVMKVTFFETVDSQSGAYTEKSFSLDLHAAEAPDLVPPGWPGKAVLLPQQTDAPSAIETR